jgi:hypothetical protein
MDDEPDEFHGRADHQDLKETEANAKTGELERQRNITVRPHS